MVKLMRSLVISMYLYAYELWTLTAELEKKMQAFDVRLLNISYKNDVTDGEVCRKIQAAIGEYDDLLTMIETKMVWPCLKVFWFSGDDPTQHS